MGKVKAIKASPNREKEQLVTLFSLDKEVLDLDYLLKMQEKCSKREWQGTTGIVAAPVSKKLPWMASFNVPDELLFDVSEGKKAHNRYYLAKIKSWKVNQTRPACEIIRSIGEAGNLDAESLRILKSHDIWSEDYDAEGNPTNEKIHESLRVFAKDIDPVIGEWKIPQDEMARRVDLRKKRIFTIDPITAKDLDDALSIEKITDEIYEIGVHIADVSYFV